MNATVRSILSSATVAGAFATAAVFVGVVVADAGSASDLDGPAPGGPAVRSNEGSSSDGTGELHGLVRAEGDRIMTALRPW